MIKHILSKASLCLVLFTSLILSGCGGGSSSSSSTAGPMYEVRLVNLTAGQPLSPIVVIVHDSTYRIFSINGTASTGLEILAEGGDKTELINEAVAANVITHASGDSPVAPGASETLSVTFPASKQATAELSVVTMLVNTNDAFVGVSGVDISDLAVNESITVNGLSYDAGTEANSEAPGTIPGPADNGEGYSSTRDDSINSIRMHTGVLTADDGLANSALNQQHRWDNPVVRITITRKR